MERAEQRELGGQIGSSADGSTRGSLTVRERGGSTLGGADNLVFTAAISTTGILTGATATKLRGFQFFAFLFHVFLFYTTGFHCYNFAASLFYLFNQITIEWQLKNNGRAPCKARWISVYSDRIANRETMGEQQVCDQRKQEEA